jgi:hypothetical protein
MLLLEMSGTADYQESLTTEHGAELFSDTFEEFLN